MQPVQALLTPSLTGMSNMFNRYDKDPTTVSLVLSPLVLQAGRRPGPARRCPAGRRPGNKSCRKVPSWAEAWEQVLQEGAKTSLQNPPLIFRTCLHVWWYRWDWDIKVNSHWWSSSGYQLELVLCGYTLLLEPPVLYHWATITGQPTITARSCMCMWYNFSSPTTPVHDHAGSQPPPHMYTPLNWLTSQSNRSLSWESIQSSMSSLFWISLRSYFCVGCCLSRGLFSPNTSVENWTWEGVECSAMMHCNPWSVDGAEG